MNKFVAFFLLLCPFIAQAQNMASLLSPHAPNSQFSLDGALYQDQREAGVFVDQKIFKNEKQRISLSSRYRELRIDHNNVLPKSYETFEGGLQYTRYLEDKKFWSVQTRIGSESDKIFANKEVNTLTANFLYRASPKWLFLANYSNNRSFLNNIPLPSVMYIHTMSREKVVLLGLPFLFIKSPLGNNFSYSLSSFIPYNHNLVVHYQAHRFIELGLGIKQNIQTFMRSDRENRDDRVYLRRRSVFLEVKSGLSRKAEIHFKTGHAFGMQLSESESYSDSDRVLTELEDGFFAQIQLDYRLF